MAQEIPSPEDRNKALTDEVWNALEDFYSFVMQPERLDAFGEAIYRKTIGPDEAGIESILADIDPEQSKKALELEDILKKIHGCVVGYKVPERGEVVGQEVIEVDGVTLITPIREEVEPEEQTVYVKDHVVDTALGSWMVGISITEVPVTKESLARRGWWIQPLGSVYDFRVIAVDHHPVEDIE